MIYRTKLKFFQIYYELEQKTFSVYIKLTYTATGQFPFTLSLSY